MILENRNPRYSPEDADTAGGAGGDLAAVKEALEPTEAVDAAIETDEELVAALENQLVPSEDLDQEAETSEAEEAAPEPDEEPEAEDEEPDLEDVLEEEATEEAPEPEDVEPEAEDEEAATEEESYPDDEDPRFQLKQFDKEIRGKVRKFADRVAKHETQVLQAEADKLKAESETFKAQAAKAESLEADLETVRAAKVIPADPVALEHIPTVDDLDAFEDESQAFEDWLEMNLDDLKGEDYDTGEAKRVKCPFLGKDHPGLTYQEARQWRLEVRKNLREVPKRRQYFAKEQQFNELLSKQVPSLRDPKSELSVKVNQVIAQMPDIKRRPDHKVAALCYVIGSQVLSAAEGDTERVLETLKTSLSNGQKAEAKSQKADDKQPARKQVARKVVKPRPVPSVRRAAASTARVKTPDSLDSMDDLVGAIERRL